MCLQGLNKAEKLKLNNQTNNLKEKMEEEHHVMIYSIFTLLQISTSSNMNQQNCIISSFLALYPAKTILRVVTNTRHSLQIVFNRHVNASRLQPTFSSKLSFLLIWKIQVQTHNSRFPLSLKSKQLNPYERNKPPKTITIKRNLNTKQQPLWNNQDSDTTLLHSHIFQCPVQYSGKISSVNTPHLISVALTAILRYN